MISATTLLLSLTLLSAEESGRDLLRFKNGDVLHGTYLGLDEGPVALWKSNEAEDQIAFNTINLRKLLFNKGRAKKAITTTGLIELVNGDLIPGSISSLGSESVTIQTDFAGLITLPRSQVVRLSPNPHGGPPIYVGPFSEEGWQILPSSSQENQTPDEEAESKNKDWTFASASWYSQSSRPLVLDTNLSDRVSIRFNLAWKNQLNCTVAFFADFKKPAPPEQDDAEDQAKPGILQPINLLDAGGRGSQAETYGTAYILSLHPSYMRLHRSFFNKDGKPETTSFKTATGNFQLRDLFTADIEIRCDRIAGTVTLFANGNYCADWADLTDPLETGRRLAFATNGGCRVRISDVVISNWNGMPDSARSMQTESSDVFLLSNGTDRISGQLLTLEEDIYRLETNYGEFMVPARDVQDIYLASDTQDEPSEPSKESVLISLQPSGRLTFEPKSGFAGKLNGSHPIAGILNFNLEYAYLLEFDPESSIFDNWDEEF
ncbi:MAG: hypothetical protein AAGC74_06540 [Verrucomicrobiota bacterium]